MSSEDTPPAPRPGFAAVVRGNVLAVGVVSLLTDLASERMNPPPPVDRVGKGVRTGPRDALIADAAPAARRGLAFSFHRAMDHAGAVIGPLVALGLLHLLLGHGSWRGDRAAPAAEELAALSIGAGLALAAAVVLLTAVRPGPGR
ncbi:hypothetical protein K7C98_31860 [Nannocystis pusilla]|uniref:MFS transporter n=1 Tax=Nannocystis pusilla TaxID=889268 RepID=A0ABS7TZZ4_9BACT|nr:hypothetical protein [Nannocystis pusilla]MBZ5713850.1 hypothetical protein [Nannocystis pusilla]